MPAKYKYKTYTTNTYYHLFNRGVNKQKIFRDEKDYIAFTSCLKLYLSPPKNKSSKSKKHFRGTSPKIKTKYFPSQNIKNYYKRVTLLAYVLMPNHFHLMVYQANKDDINFFMRSLLTKYSMYFNKKYNRVGPLFQGRYKAVPIKSEQQFLYLSKYIHRNPIPILGERPLKSYEYSSYQNYIGIKQQKWVKPKNILSYFSKIRPNNSYQQFVEESAIELDKTLTLE